MEVALQAWTALTAGTFVSRSTGRLVCHSQCSWVSHSAWWPFWFCHEKTLYFINALVHWEETWYISSESCPKHTWEKWAQCNQEVKKYWTKCIKIYTFVKSLWTWDPQFLQSCRVNEFEDVSRQQRWCFDVLL